MLKIRKDIKDFPFLEKDIRPGWVLIYLNKEYKIPKLFKVFLTKGGQLFKLFGVKLIRVLRYKSANIYIHLIYNKNGPSQ